jgi:uncharacterized iron-regulated membrane protein
LPCDVFTLAVMAAEIDWLIEPAMRVTPQERQFGVPLVALMSIPLLLMLASSLFIYKRWWRGFLTWPRKGKPRLTWGDVHRLAGVWSLGFMLLIGVTAFWYLVESLGGEGAASSRDRAAQGQCQARAVGGRRRRQGNLRGTGGVARSEDLQLAADPQREGPVVVRAGEWIAVA